MAIEDSQQHLTRKRLGLRRTKADIRTNREIRMGLARVVSSEVSSYSRLGCRKHVE